MSSTTDRRYVAPKYIGLLTSGIITAAVGAAGIAVVTTYGTHAPGTITPGWTAILATTCVIGSGLILTAWGLRIVMRKLASIERKVDAHGRHVEREHGGLHEDAVDIGEQLAELRALVAEMSLDVAPERTDAIVEAAMRKLLEELAELEDEPPADPTPPTPSPAGPALTQFIPPPVANGHRDAAWMADMAESLNIGREIERRRQDPGSAA